MLLIVVCFLGMYVFNDFVDAVRCVFAWCVREFGLLIVLCFLVCMLVDCCCLLLLVFWCV